MSHDDELTSKINAEYLVDSIFRIKNDNKGDSANLRRANNPSTQHYAWPIMVRLGFSLKNEKNNAIIPLVASSIANEKATLNGTVPFAKIFGVLAKEFPSLEVRFSRMINATNTVELCSLLSANIKSLQSRTSGKGIDYISLTKDLLYFDYKRDAIRAKWTEQFYQSHRPVEDKKD